MNEIRFQYPGGHPDFIDLTLDELKLHAEKNTDYTKGGDPLGNFNRVASILALYPKLSLSHPGVVAIVYALKQLDAALWMLNQGYEGKVEGIQDRLRDIHVYMKLARILIKERIGKVNTLKKGIVGVPEFTPEQVKAWDDYKAERLSNEPCKPTKDGVLVKGDKL